MPIPDTLPRKITADFRAEKSMGAEKIFVTLCDMAADVLATKGARASSTMILT